MLIVTPKTCAGYTMKRPFSVSPDSPGFGFSFGGFRLEADGTLYRGDAIVHLPPKELAALRLLLTHAGQVVTPQQLTQELWGEVHVTPDSIPKCLSSLRARLEPEQCIQTVYKRGYRFSSEVHRYGEIEAEALPRLAIMPFATGYTVPDYLGMAVAEETLAQLAGARNPVASLLARDSVFTMARRGLTAQELGKALKADFVLTGTLRALSSHFRLRVEMIRVADGTELWVEDMLVALTQLAGIESELVRRLTGRLTSGELSVAAPIPEADNSPQRTEAYEILLRARYEWQTLQRHQMQDGLQHLSQAADLDPSLVAARIEIANACVTQALFGYMTPSLAAERVHQVAKSISGNLHRQAEAMLPTLGWVKFHIDRDLPAACEAFSLSDHLTHDPWITRSRVQFALSRHRFNEALDLLREALHLDPYSPWLHARLAWSLHLAGQATESVEQIRHTLSLFPDDDSVMIYGAILLTYNGDVTAGMELAHHLVRHSPYLDLGPAIHAYTLACAGRKDEARTILERLQWLSRERYVLRSFTPATHVALGDMDAALAELRAVNELRCPWFFQMLADPRLKPLHGLPEYAKLQAALVDMETTVALEPEMADPDDLRQLAGNFHR